MVDTFASLLAEVPFAPERNNIFLQHMELRRKGIVWELCPEEAQTLLPLSVNNKYKNRQNVRMAGIFCVLYCLIGIVF